MPQRKISIPAPITFLDPGTGLPVPPPQGVLTFADFVGRLAANPLWAESLKAAQAQRSISAALASAGAAAADGAAASTMTISEEDWAFLEQAVRTPRTTTFGLGGDARVMSGFGFHPALSGQLVPFSLAIVNAEVL